ncbi:hypothetical protein [Acidaminococcus fermentans]|uniref:hypothetical protein n=1 Tax=Acidaminococcus fermentans TaxID=905 RepID=UPI003078074F
MPGEANYDIRMYMDILDEENIQICQHTYTGRITHYGALTNMELAQKLTISKEDIRLLELYNLFVVL